MTDLQYTRVISTSRRHNYVVLRYSKLVSFHNTSFICNHFAHNPVQQHSRNPTNISHHDFQHQHFPSSYCNSNKPLNYRSPSSKRGLVKTTLSGLFRRNPNDSSINSKNSNSSSAPKQHSLDNNRAKMLYMREERVLDSYYRISAKAA